MKEELNTPWTGKNPPQRRQVGEEKEMSTSIRINEEFSKIIPPLTVSEKYNLQQSLKKEGCRDPLVIWNGTLIDGHNRYKYCTEHSIPFKVVERHFSDDDEAKLWMIENQMARRNLNKAATLLLEEERKKIVARQANKRMKAGKKIDPGLISGQGSQDNSSGRTNRRLSKTTGIGHDTISKFNYIKTHADEDVISGLCEERIEDGKKMTISGEYEKLRKKERQEELRHKGFPLNKYDVLYADPGTTSIELLKKYPVELMAKQSSVLFLWSTIEGLKLAMDLLDHWNFEYLTTLLWNHQNPREMNRTDIHHEFLLVSYRGDYSNNIFPENFQRFPYETSTNTPRVLPSSERPDMFKSIIHELYPTKKKVILFGDTTQKKEGWDIYNYNENAKNLWR